MIACLAKFLSRDYNFQPQRKQTVLLFEAPQVVLRLSRDSQMGGVEIRATQTLGISAPGRLQNPPKTCNKPSFFYETMGLFQRKGD